jgi:hypothetical protein
VVVQHCECTNCCFRMVNLTWLLPQFKRLVNEKKRGKLDWRGRNTQEWGPRESLPCSSQHQRRHTWNFQGITAKSGVQSTGEALRRQQSCTSLTGHLGVGDCSLLTHAYVFATKAKASDHEATGTYLPEFFTWRVKERMHTLPAEMGQTRMPDGTF